MAGVAAMLAWLSWRRNRMAVKIIGNAGYAMRISSYSLQPSASSAQRRISETSASYGV